MQFETIQGKLLAIGIFWPIITLVWIVSAILCFTLKKNRNMAPFWTLMACPMIYLYVLAAIMLWQTSRLGHAPDDGWGRMGTGLALGMLRYVFLAGLLHLAAFPGRAAFKKRNTFILCLIAAAISTFASAAVFHSASLVRRAPHTVEIIVTNDFRGPISIREDKANGVPPERDKEITRYYIPKSGALLTSDARALRAWHENVGKRENGTWLPDGATQKDVGLDCLFEIGTADGEFLMWVGSKAEWGYRPQTPGELQKQIEHNRKNN